MISLLALVAALIYLIIYYAVRAGEESSSNSISSGYSGGYDEDWEEKRYPGSSKIDQIFNEHIGKLEGVLTCLRVRVAGTSHRNDNGTSRTAVIRECEALEDLELRIEPDNPVDPLAIAVYRKDGSQLGYVDHITAMRISLDTGMPFARNAVFRYATRHPETNTVVGAAIYLVRLKDDLLIVENSPT